MSNDIIIPEHELEITTSRSGGAGGQHVNKTDSRITIRWNIRNTTALTPEQKDRLLINLHSRLTTDGELLVNNSESRSQQHNKKAAFDQLMRLIKKGLYVPKKRMATRPSKMKKEARLKEKSHRGEIKRMRSKKFDE